MSTPFDAVPQHAQGGYVAPQYQAPAQAPGMDPQQFAAFQAWQAQQAAAQYTQQAPQFAAPPAPAQPVQQAPQAQLPVGTLDDFYNQPQSANGKSLAFEELGDGYVVRVARSVTNGDVRAQTDDAGNPTFFRDGRAKLVLVLPVQIYQYGTAQKPMGPLPEGVTEASWWVKGKDWAALTAAMAESGYTGQLPEEGAFIKVVFTKKQKNRPPMNDTKLKDVQYVRPEGASTERVQLDVQEAWQQACGAEAAAAPATLVHETAPVGQPTAAPAAPPASPANVEAPAMSLTPEMAAKLAELTGGK